MADETIFLGTVGDTAPRANQKIRKDERLVTDRYSNVVIDSGTEFSILDSKEKGELISIRVVSDNPYLDVHLELDDWRNEGENAASLLFSGTTSAERGFYASGSSPATGYSLIYNPQHPEPYERRIRVVIRNKLPKTTALYGSSNRFSFAGIAPANCGHSGGSVFASPNLAGATDVQMANAMTMPLDSGPYDTAGIVNRVFLDGITKLKPGSIHPYVGIAGKPIFTRATGTNAEGAAGGSLTVFFDDANDQWPEGTQDVYFADMTDASSDCNTGIKTIIDAGGRLFVRDEGNIYFAGEVTAVAASQTLPAKFGKVGGSAVSACMKYTVAPGLKLPPPAVMSDVQADSSSNATNRAFGAVTSQADTNPHILLKSVEVKRMKRVSLDG